MKTALKKCYALAALGVVLPFVMAGQAMAAAAPAAVGNNEVDTVLYNISSSADSLPGLLTACAYLLGLLLGVLGVLKIKDHVESPNNTPLRTGVIRLLAGGALFALPFIYDAVMNSINGGANQVFNPGGTIGGAIGLGAGAIPSLGVSAVLTSIGNSVDGAPGIISALTYLLGLLFGVTGILKIKDHVESPENTPMREGIIRLLAAGALFATPTIYEAVYEAIQGNGGGLGSIFNMSAIGFFFSVWSRSACNPLGGFGVGAGNTVGVAICTVIYSSAVIPAFLTGVGYLIGLVMTVWGILKIKAHVNDPRQTQLHEGIMRLLAGGAFFALPYVVQVMQATIASPALTVAGMTPYLQNFNQPGAAAGQCTGLDGIVYCFANDIFGPMHMLVNFFAFCAGAVLIMIGISRLIKGAQDGARGPGGLGTIMTFGAGGALISYNELMRAATASFFALPTTAVNAQLKYTQGMSQNEIDHAHVVISAILKFMIVVGLVSFVRGIFIIRDVAEGNSQASLMAGVTHMVGGALAVNLGPLINAVETTLGIASYGISFT